MCWEFTEPGLKLPPAQPNAKWPQKSPGNLGQQGWAPTSKLNAHLSNWGVVPPKKQKSKQKWSWPNMKGQGLCDGNVIVNLYGQLRLRRLDALQILKYTLGFHLFPPSPSPTQKTATKQESLTSPSKRTRMKRKTVRLPARKGILHCPLHCWHVTFDVKDLNTFRGES